MIYLKHDLQSADGDGDSKNALAGGWYNSSTATFALLNKPVGDTPVKMNPYLLGTTL